MTTRAEMNRRKEQVWDCLNQRGPSKVSEIRFTLTGGSWQDVDGGWGFAKVDSALKALQAEGRVNCWGKPWGYGKVWITVPTQVSDDLIDAIEEIGQQSKIRFLLRDEERRRG